MSSKKPIKKITSIRELSELKTLLKNSNRIALSTHQLPDGDGLGAEVALFHYIKQTHKICQVINPDPIPQRYHFLDPQDQFLTESSPQWAEQDFDLWIIVDTNDPRRLGALWPKLAPRSERIVFLDHHPEIQGKDQINYPSNAMLITDTRSSSIGELLYQLFNTVNIASITPQVALGLYVSVMTDTNSFRYSRTTPLAHHIAGEMIQLGVNPEEIYQAIYSSKEVSHLQLLGTLLQKVQVSQNGKVAWIEMSAQLRHQYQASADETLSFLNLLLLIRNAEIICFFREEDHGSVRVSIKSKGRIVINQLAMEMGGGGHDYAAGLSSSLPLNQLRDQVISRLEQLTQIRMDQHT